VIEELDELEGATMPARLDEAGDLLFAAVNVVEATASRPKTRCATATKFERRFRAMEALAGGGLCRSTWQAKKRCGRR
jgi:ATP diphosphatase